MTDTQGSRATLSRWGRLHSLSQFHESLETVAAWRRRTGPVLAWLQPGRRRAILLAGAVLVFLFRPAGMVLDARVAGLPGVGLMPLVLLLLLGFVWLCFLAARNFARLPAWIRRRPQWVMHAVFWALLGVLWCTTPAAGAWRSVIVGAAIVLPFLLWRCGYMLLSGQRGRASGTRFRDHLVYLFPPWGGSDTPYGKGLDYLSRCEARSEEDLARSQLAGLKLFALAALWHLAAAVMDSTVYGDATSGQGPAGLALGVPRVGDLVRAGSPAPLLLSWASIYCELVRQVLGHASQGHVTIGILRLLGFNVFRNTYKPLLAESISAFWNRYFYYFKELLSELFFMPVFARWFRKWNRLRLFAAVMAAAGFGNMYYHVLRREDLLIAGHVGALWSQFHSRAFYCFLLAVGIFVSMVREQARAGATRSDALHRRIVRIAGVWTFFALIFIWNAKGGADFWQRTQFFMSLFGMGRA